MTKIARKPGTSTNASLASDCAATQQGRHAFLVVGKQPCEVSGQVVVKQTAQAIAPRSHTPRENPAKGFAGRCFRSHPSRSAHHPYSEDADRPARPAPRPSSPPVEVQSSTRSSRSWLKHFQQSFPEISNDRGPLPLVGRVRVGGGAANRHLEKSHSSSRKRFNSLFRGAAPPPRRLSPQGGRGSWKIPKRLSTGRRQVRGPSFADLRIAWRHRSPTPPVTKLKRTHNQYE